MATELEINALRFIIHQVDEQQGKRMYAAILENILFDFKTSANEVARLNGLVKTLEEESTQLQGMIPKAEVEGKTVAVDPYDMLIQELGEEETLP